jgi:hypothetical protein
MVAVVKQAQGHETLRSARQQFQKAGPQVRQPLPHQNVLLTTTGILAPGIKKMNHFETPLCPCVGAQLMFRIPGGSCEHGSFWFWHAKIELFFCC